MIDLQYDAEVRENVTVDSGCPICSATFTAPATINCLRGVELQCGEGSFTYVPAG
jgi:hypothetical protein